MARNIYPITGCLDPNRGLNGYVPSWITACTDPATNTTNPTLNSLLDQIDQHTQVKTEITVSHQCWTDYTCDYVADEVQINEAIAYARDNNYSKVRIINDGVYNLQFKIEAPYAKNMVIDFCGSTLKSTQYGSEWAIYLANASDVAINRVYIPSDGSFQDKIVLGGCGRCHINDCLLVSGPTATNTKSVVIDNSQECSVNRCRIEDSVIGKHSVFINYGMRNIVKDSFISGSLETSIFSTHSPYTFVTNNNLEFSVGRAINFTQAYSSIVIGNHMGHSGSASNPLVTFNDCAFGTIGNNIIESATGSIYSAIELIASSEYSTITGNATGGFAGGLVVGNTGNTGIAGNVI